MWSTLVMFFKTPPLTLFIDIIASYIFFFVYAHILATLFLPSNIPTKRQETKQTKGEFVYCVHCVRVQ